MPKSVSTDERRIAPPPFFIQKFGGGVNTRASENEINPRESVSGGKNRELDPVNLNLRPRKPYDLLDTAPNGERINGMINLLKSDGTSQIAVQAGDKVYEYLGSSSGFNATPIATLSSSNARLRGRLEQNWALDDKVIVTDLALSEEVIEWDGTTWQDVTFSPSGSTIRAKYGVVARERLWLANIDDTTTATPHIFIASSLTDYTTIDITSRPNSALGDGDPFFLVSPDLRAINGFVQEFGQVFFSTEDGKMHIMAGQSATDYNVEEFYPRSFSSGQESMVSIGNKVLYGRRGRIELLSDTDRFADSNANDASYLIADEISTYKDWTIVYNNRLQRAYCFPDGQSECWMFDLTMLPTGLSPWEKYTTTHSLAFRPTTTMNMIDPDDGLEYVYMGDGSGNFYKLEGSGTSGDAGTDEIQTVFIGPVNSYQPDQQMTDFTGYVRYKKSEAFNINITFRYAGKTAINESIGVSVPSSEASAFYSNSQYYSNIVYYGRSFEGRLLRQDFSVVGSGEDVQFRLEVTSAESWEVNEIGVRFKASNI